MEWRNTAPENTTLAQSERTMPQNKRTKKVDNVIAVTRDAVKEGCRHTVKPAAGTITLGALRQQASAAPEWGSL